MTKLFYGLSLWLWLCVASTAHAITTYTYKDIKFGIAGYLGYKSIFTTARNSSLPSAPELGLDLSAEINDNWSLFTQFQYDETSIEHALAYSFISYHTHVTDDLEFTARVGKIRNDFALFNSTRINPRTRQGVIMPQSIYWDSIRYFMTSGDGINLRFKIHNLELGYTVTSPEVVNQTKEAKVWADNMLGHIHTTFGSFQMANLKYTFEDIPLVFKSSYARVNLGNNNSIWFKNAFPQWANRDQVFDIWSNGFIYDIGTWTFSAESLLLRPFFGDLFDSSKNSMGSSFTIEHEVNHNLNVRVNYNMFETGLVSTPEYFNSAKDINFGINYHQDRWQIGAEVHHINGSQWIHPDDVAKDPGSYKEWWMFGINAVYFF